MNKSTTQLTAAFPIPVLLMELLGIAGDSESLTKNLPHKIFEIEVFRNGISDILRPSQHVIMS